MPDIVNITIDASIKEDKNGVQIIKVKDYLEKGQDVKDSQQVFFFDGDDWDIQAIEIKDFHKDDKKDEDPDEFNFDLSLFDDDFTVDIDKEQADDCFIVDKASSFVEVGGVYTITYLGSDDVEHVVTIDPGIACMIINTVCLTPETQILTMDGYMLVGDLQVGDLVMTKDNGPQSIHWIGRRKICFLNEETDLKPVVFPQGSLGTNVPFEDLITSPQHRIVLTGEQVKAVASENEALAAAKLLIGSHGVRIARGKRIVEYVSLLFAEHQILNANGVEVESLLPRPYARTFLPTHQVSEIEALFPGVFSDEFESIYPASRLILSSQEIKKIRNPAQYIAKAFSIEELP